MSHYPTRRYPLWLALPGRYLAGRPLDGDPRTDSTFTRPGTVALTRTGRASRWAMLRGSERAAWRVLAPLSVAGSWWAYAEYPTATASGGAAAGTVLGARAARRARTRLRTRRFRSTYVRPLARVLAPSLGIQPYLDPDKWLTVSPDLAGLAPRLVRPMSPAELWIRGRYAEHAEPLIRWVPDRTMRAYWWLGESARPAFNWLDVFRMPVPEKGPRVEIQVPDVFVTEEMKKHTRQAVAAKLGLGDLVESWCQIGNVATGTYTVKVRPPDRVGLDDVLPAIEGCEEHEFVAGMAAGGTPVIISLDDDAPHIACSAGSGAGKSVLAMLFGVQVLRKGGRVIILDRKGSHRWARGLTGVTYCTKPANMHAALIGAASLADARNTQAMEEEEDWNPGERVFIIFEEMNATVAMLKGYWENAREKEDPKASPAIQAFRDLMYMGRSAKCNLFGVAQMLTAQTTGGPEARENFGVRCLARYTANNWKMLAPECPMPRKSKTRGRWQIVIAGEAVETQVAYLHPEEARALARPVVTVAVSASPRLRLVDGQGDRPGTPGPETDAELAAMGTPPPAVSLREAVEQGIIPMTLAALKKARTRDRENFPGYLDRDGAELKYGPSSLRDWYENRSGRETEDAR